jgi:hypothetical protein
MYRASQEGSYFTVQELHSGEQHAMSSAELQSALMLAVEFSKMYYTRYNCTNFVTWTINTGIRNSI